MKDNLPRIKSVYDSTYDGYDELYGEEQLIKYTMALRRIKLKGRILDVGCGTGLLLEFLESQALFSDVEKYVCLDISEGMLSLAFKRSKRLCKGKCLNVLGDALHLPFPEESFDFTLSFTVLDLLNKPLMGLKEMLRVTREAVVISLLTRLKNWTDFLRFGKEIGRTDKDVILLFNVKQALDGYLRKSIP